MNVFFTSSRNQFRPQEFGIALDEMVSIGINTLFIVTYHFSRDELSDSIFATQESVPESTLCDIIEVTMSKGIEPVLKPHIDLLNGKPRYCIKPQKIDSWVRSYRNIIKSYIALSNRYGLKRIVVGTELDNVADTREFHDMISNDIRPIYKKEIIYASSFDHFISCKIWNVVDIIGVNTYFNLCKSDNCLMSELVESWNYWLTVLDHISICKGKPVYISEIGYYSRDGCSINPGDWSRGGEISFDEQAKAYEALLCQAAGFPNLKGIFWWQWELNNAWNNDSADYTPRNKPACDVIRSYWK